jgi:hypothetical protein
MLGDHEAKAESDEVVGATAHDFFPGDVVQMQYREVPVLDDD